MNDPSAIVPGVKVAASGSTSGVFCGNVPSIMNNLEEGATCDVVDGAFLISASERRVTNHVTGTAT